MQNFGVMGLCTNVLQVRMPRHEILSHFEFEGACCRRSMERWYCSYCAAVLAAFNKKHKAALLPHGLVPWVTCITGDICKLCLSGVGARWVTTRLDLHHCKAVQGRRLPMAIRASCSALSCIHDAHRMTRRTMPARAVLITSLQADVSHVVTCSTAEQHERLLS